MKNKKVLLTAFGSTDGYSLAEEEIEEPKANEVRIKILASGIAYADVLMRKGKYPGMPKLPFTPGYDIVGIVEKAVGSSGKKYEGKKVAALTVFGGYQQYINLDVSKVLEIPQDLDPAKAVCLVLNYMTAYQSLIQSASAKQGDTILVHGAAGGVGSAMLQLARNFGIKAYGTASSGKLDLVDKEGAMPIDYKHEDFEKIIKDKEPEGIDAFFGFHGGEVFEKSMHLLKKKGTAVIYALNDADNFLQIGGYILKFLVKNIFSSKKITFYNVQGKHKNREKFHSDLTKLMEMLKDGKIDPYIDERIELEQVPVAHRKFENHEYTGKVVIEPNRE